MVKAENLHVIKTMDRFLSDEWNRIYGETYVLVEKLRKELRSILDLVVDKKLKEGSLKYWTFDVIEIAHDVHLLFDDENPHYLWMPSKVSHILRVLSETRKRILQLEVLGENKPPMITSSSPPHKNAVGLEQDVEAVLKLIHKEAGLCAACIVGMTGVGKTTLAREVYHHASVVDRFEPRVWLSVSGDPSNKEVLMKLILQLVDNKDESHVLLEEMDNQSLQRMLHQHLEGKNFLIVLDDIGEIPYPESIFKALPAKGKSSRLLLTSQFRSTNRRIYNCPYVYTMTPLDDDRSWQLFLKLLLLEDQEFPKELEEKGREMLRSCDGLPYSIKEAATKLAIKRQGGGEWEQLLESIDLSGTLALLESVVQRWPPQLKLCFLCLSFFKKGIPIRAEKLLLVWTAGQVIPHEEEEEYPDFKKVNFNMNFLQGYKTTFVKLIDEFIVEVDFRKNKTVKCICVNASFHTLSMVKAEEEMVLENLKDGDGNPTSSKVEPRHRAIYCSRNEFNHFTDHDEGLISLFFRGGGCIDASGPYWKRFERLRTLDFENFGLKMLPETIGVLTELRYLGLRDNYVQELPRSLGSLKNLEVLDIALNFAVVVPKIVWEISSLLHVYMSDIICVEPFKIDALENLETLTYISVDNWTYEVSSLKMMTSLRKLGIEEVDESLDASKLFASLADLKNLECLKLRGFRFRSFPSLHGLGTLRHLTELTLEGLITKLPIADSFPPTLTHLSLINSSLDEDPMRQLLGLGILKYVKLKNAYTGQQMKIFGHPRSKLKVLCLEELWHLRCITFERILLEKVEIKSCPFLETIPIAIHRYSVEELKIVTTRTLAPKIRKSLGNSCKTIGHADIQP